MRPRIWAVGLLVTAGLAACGNQDEDAATPAPEETTTATEETTTEEPTEDGAGADAAALELAVAETDLGTIVVDGAGMTLYLFTNDSPGASVCEDACLEAWPPLLGEPTAGDGVSADLLGTIERSDGSVQASYNDWPLYYWAQDSAPGDTAGQGVNDVWYVLTPEGEPIM